MSSEKRYKKEKELVIELDNQVKGGLNLMEKAQKFSVVVRPVSCQIVAPSRFEVI